MSPTSFSFLFRLPFIFAALSGCCVLLFFFTSKTTHATHRLCFTLNVLIHGCNYAFNVPRHDDTATRVLHYLTTSCKVSKSNMFTEALPQERTHVPFVPNFSWRIDYSTCKITSTTSIRLLAFPLTSSRTLVSVDDFPT